jgi:hypothetical protein
MGDDLRGQPFAQAFLRLHLAREEHQFPRLGRADHLGQEVGSADVARQSHVGVGTVEIGLVGQDAEVAGQCRRHASADGRAIHHGDGGLGHALQLVVHLCRFVEALDAHFRFVPDRVVAVLDGQRVERIRLAEVFDVTAGTEGASRTRDDHHAHFRIADGQAQRIGDAVTHGRAHRIHGVWPIEGQDEHTLLQSGLDQLFTHANSSKMRLRDIASRVQMQYSEPPPARPDIPNNQRP